MTLKNYLAAIALLLTFPFESYSHGVAIVNADAQQYFQLNSSSVEVNVKNQIAVVTSNQIFINNTGNTTRTKYAFPLPEGANPISLRWFVNGEWKEAEVSGDSQDTTLPSNGGPSGSGGSGGGGTASFELEEYLGEYALFFDVADFLEPNESIEFELSYVQLLPYSFGEVSFNYPNRYNLIQTTPIESNIFTFSLESERTIETIDLPEFDEDMTANMDNTNVILEYNGVNDLPENNFSLTYQLKSDQLGVYSMSTFLPDSLVTCDEFGSGFVSLILEPESNEEVDVIEKNFSLVIDRSGSMDGDKMDQAKEAAKFIINNLNDGDRFNIIDFSTQIESFSMSHVDNGPLTVAAALAYIDELDAGGSTNINDAMVETIYDFSTAQPDKANIIIFFTDGLATVGETNTEDILQNVVEANNLSETNVFLFTFGIGNNVDQALLTLLARQNSGLVNFLENQELEEEITNFFLKVNNPVLINTSIEIFPEGSIQSFHPSLVPNLYKGQQLIISGRYDTPQDVNITLEGMAFNLPVSYDFPVSLSDSMVVDQSFLPKIWAKQKIDELAIDYVLASSSIEEENIQNDIDELSTCYSIVSVAFSSFEDTSLEVDFKNFEASKEEDGVLLEWTTAVEINNDRFIIERSADGIDFEEIGIVFGAGNSTQDISYDFKDYKPLEGVSYYRLKQIDIDGRFSYSEVVVIILDFANDNIRYLLYPNPLPQGENLFVDSNNSQEITVEIIDGFGRMVYANKVQTQDYIDTPQLIKGSYVVNLVSNGQSFVYKLFVN